MTPVSIGCLLLGLSALALCGLCWYRGLALGTADSASKDKSGLRNRLALSALSCATASATIYVTFLLLWAYSYHSFNGRQTSGAVAIWVGLFCAGFAFVAGIAARGIVRAFILVSAAVALFLWLLAGAASVAV
jgi:hypothetical protein